MNQYKEIDNHLASGCWRVVDRSIVPPCCLPVLIHFFLYLVCVLLFPVFVCSAVYQCVETNQRQLHSSHVSLKQAPSNFPCLCQTETESPVRCTYGGRRGGELVTVATRRVTPGIGTSREEGGGGVKGREGRRQIRGRCQWVFPGLAAETKEAVLCWSQRCFGLSELHLAAPTSPDTTLLLRLSPKLHHTIAH